MRASVRDELTAAGLAPDAVERIIVNALEEDLGGPDGVDVTSVATIPDDQTDVGDLVARQNGVVAGLFVAAAVFAALLFFSGSALTDQAQAQDRGYDNYYYQYGGSAPILGEGGAQWGGQCWVETWGGGTSYFGYWKPCAAAAPARTARH